MEPISTILHELRKQMSQQEIAEAIGTNQSLVSRWERGGISGSADTAIKLIELARVRGINVGAATSELAHDTSEQVPA